MLNPNDFASWLQQQVKDGCGYIMGSVGQDPKKLSPWYYDQYTGKERTQAEYWKAHAPRVFDCQGMADCYVTEHTEGSVNVRARNNFNEWCGIRGEGKIPKEKRCAGAAVFMYGQKEGYITHVGFLVRPVTAGKNDGDWIVVEARGVMYGVVETKLSERNWNRWGLMTKYFKYNEMPSSNDYGWRNLKKGCVGSDVAALQRDMIALGYSCGVYGADGDFGAATERAVKAFQSDTMLEVDGIAGPLTFDTIDIMMRDNSDPSAVEKVDGPTIVVNQGTWYLRNEPSAGGKIMGIVKGGTVLECSGTTGEWYRVTLDDGEQAWIGKKGVKEYVVG